METENNIIKDIAIATTKGIASELPFIGGLLSEYIGLTKERIASKRQKEWQNMVEEILSKIKDDITKITTNEFFYSCVQTATVGALKAYQKEKCKLFANALYNSYIITDMAEEKKLIFISLLDKYTLLAIKVLKCYSEDNFEKYDEKIYREKNPNPNNMMEIFTHHGQEKPVDYLIDEIPELATERELAKAIVTQLHADGLIESVDFNIPEYPQSSRRKHSTALGDEFLNFIYEG